MGSCAVALGRIVRSADFERVLTCAPRAKTAHFALHHLADVPSRPVAPKGVRATELSTRLMGNGTPAVDESRVPMLQHPAPQGWWLGLVVPKRHARRAVTRNLLKRSIRSAMAHHVDRLDKGLWVVRLRAPFDKTKFPSATSSSLQASASLELEQAWRQACEAVSRSGRAGGRRA